MIRIDPEFQALIPPLTADEYAQLEKNILKDGIRDPLVIWKAPGGDEILIDGHNRWKISAAHSGIQFKVQYMEFDSRADVIRWIILNQFGRRNLSAYDRSILALKLKPVIQKQAEQRKEETVGRPEMAKKSAPIETRTEIAKIAGVSHDTIRKVETIAKEADEHTKQLVRNGEKSINQAYNEIKAREIKRMPTAQEYQDAAQKRHDAVKDTKTVSIADLQQDKEDRKILEDAAIAKVRRALDAVSRLYVETSNRELNIDILSQSVKERLSGDVKSMISALKAIQTAIERE